MHMTRRLTILHSAEADVVHGDAALDPAIILPDRKLNEQKALLERPLFGLESCGRIRFRHHSIAEYLAAERLITLQERGMPFRALKRPLSAETKGGSNSRANSTEFNHLYSVRREFLNARWYKFMPSR